MVPFFFKSFINTFKIPIERAELRPPIIDSVISFVLAISDNKQELFIQLRWLSRLLELWSNRLTEKESGKRKNSNRKVKFRPSRIEGFALIFLCNSNAKLRGCALKILESIRNIDLVYNAEKYSISYKKKLLSPLRLINVIEELNTEVISQLISDFRFRKIYCIEFKVAKGLSIATLALSDTEQNAWTYVLGTLFQNFAKICPKQMSVATEMTKQRVANFLPNEKSPHSIIHLWANYFTLLCSASPGLYESGSQSELTKLVPQKYSFHSKIFDDILSLISKYEAIFHIPSIFILYRSHSHLYLALFSRLEEFLSKEREKEKKKKKTPIYLRKLEFVSTIYSVSLSKLPYNNGILSNEKILSFYRSHIEQMYSCLSSIEDLTDMSPQNLNLIYNFCETIRNVSEELSCSATSHPESFTIENVETTHFSGEMRDKLFLLLSKFSTCQSHLTEYKMKEINSKLKLKNDKKNEYMNSLVSHLEYVEYYSIKAISSFLKIHLLLDINKDCLVLNWINKMLEKHQEHKFDVSNQKLLNKNYSSPSSMVYQAGGDLTPTESNETKEKIIISEDNFNGGMLTSRTKNKKNFFCITIF